MQKRQKRVDCIEGQSSATLLAIAGTKMDLSLLFLNTSIAGLFAMLVFSFSMITIWRLRTAAANAILPEPPKVAGGWPLTAPVPPHVTLGALADKYGPVFSIRIGIHSALVVNTWEAAKECFTSNDLVISQRPKTIAAEILSYNHAMLGLSPYGAYWRDLCKIIVQELLSSHMLEQFKHVRESEVVMATKEVYNLWTKRNDSKENGSGQLLVELKQWFNDLTLKVFFRMVAGNRYNNLGDEIEEVRCHKAVRELFHFIGLFAFGDAVPWLRFLDIGGHEKAMKKTANELDTIVMSWLEKHKQRRAKDGDNNRDFIDLMLSVLDRQNVAQHESFDADTVMKATIVNLIAGGSDPTSVLMGCAISMLLDNRHALKKVYEELDNHVGKGRLVNELDINNLVYLQAVIKYATFSGYREFTEDCIVGGYHVPKGTWLIVNAWKIHTDPQDVDVKGRHFELMPFGSGRRACPGINLGLHLTVLILASFLHAFEISTPTNATVDMCQGFGDSNKKSTLLRVLVEPRLPPNLYE
ncbi:unnamed protein product [Malus baccata var. baccata]